MKSVETLEGMTLDELLAEKLVIDAQIEELRAQKRVIAGIENQKLAEQESQRRLASLSDEEKASLAQVLSAQGFDASK